MKYAVNKDIMDNGLIEIFPVDSRQNMADMLREALSRVTLD